MYGFRKHTGIKYLTHSVSGDYYARETNWVQKSILKSFRLVIIILLCIKSKRKIYWENMINPQSIKFDNEINKQLIVCKFIIILDKCM